MQLHENQTTRSLDRSTENVTPGMGKALLNLVKRFIERGCPSDGVDNLGNRPLHYACKFGDLDIVRCLILEFNVNVMSTNKNGKSPLDCCSSEELRAFVSALMPCEPIQNLGADLKSDMIICNVDTNAKSVASLQRVQECLLKAFEDASSVLSEELLRETQSERDANENRVLSLGAKVTPNVSLDVLNASERKRDHLEKEMQKQYQENQRELEIRDAQIESLENEMEALKNLQEKAAIELADTLQSLEETKSNLEEAHSQCDLVKSSLVKMTNLSQSLSARFHEDDRNRTQQLAALQGRISDLELLIHRKDEVLRQFSDTQRVLGRREPAGSAKIAQLDLHLDILKANADAVAEDIKAMTSLLEKDASEEPSEKDKSQTRLEHEVARLRKEQISLQQQISAKIQERDSVMRASQEQSSPDHSPRGFMHLDDLLGQLQVNTVEVTPPYTPSDSPVKGKEDQESPSRAYRMSTVFNKEDVDVDPLLLNQLLDAAKRRIQRLKSTCENLREESHALKAQLEEKDLHIQETYGLLQSANRRVAEAESKFSRVGSDQDKAIRKFEKLSLERMVELKHLHEAVIQLTGASQSSTDDFVTVQGILGQLRGLLLELDPSVLSGVPAHLLDSSVDDFLQTIELPHDTKLDVHRYNSHLVSSLASALGRVKEYLEHIGTSFGYMKGENKKFVKEIMRLKKAAVVQSLVSGVRDSVVEPFGAKSRISRFDMDGDFRRPSPRRQVHVPSVSPVSPLVLPTTPQRPVRIERESTVSNISGVSDTSTSRMSITSMPGEAAELLDSLKRLKLEIARVQSQEFTPENKTQIDELKQEYRGFVKRLMSTLKQETASQSPQKKVDSPASTKGQELKERLKKVCHCFFFYVVDGLQSRRYQRNAQ